MWSQDSNKEPFSDFMVSAYKNPQIRYVQVPDTQFSLLELNGGITALILDRGNWELWRLDGMLAFKNGKVKATVRSRVLTLSRIEGGARRKWTLDFSDSAKGLEVRYSE